MTINQDSLQILRLLQLTSPALPVGAYSYSEGIEYLCDQGTISNELELSNWLSREIQSGFISTEAAIALRAYQAIQSGDLDTLLYWNHWLSATREAEEIRLASWQMGQSLIKLWDQLPDHSHNSAFLPKLKSAVIQILPNSKDNSQGKGCNYAIAFGIVAASLEIDAKNMIAGYIYSWLSNLVSAAVRAVPFGQTTGQQIIFRLSPDVIQISQLVLDRLDSELEWCGWGASLACANHETQYSRLFRS